MNISPDLAEFIGAFIGDGYMGNYKKGEYLIAIVGHSKLDYQYISVHLKSIIEKELGIKPYIYIRKDEQTMILKINSLKLYKLFIKLGFKQGKKSRVVRIPEIIICDEKLLCRTIRGIFDTDGCVFLDHRKKYKKPYPRITLQTASIDLIEQLHKYLSKHFKLYINKTNRDGYRNYIEIYGLQQLEKFLKHIGFSNIRHFKKTMPL